MTTESCLISGCTEPIYGPAGTRSLCKEHFLQFVGWRKKKGGLGMFKKYSAQTMEVRNETVEEWAKSLMAASSS